MAFTTKQKSSIIHLIEVEKKTYSEVARILGVDKRSVRNFAVRSGVKYHKEMIHPIPWSDDEISELKGYLLQNKDFKEIEKLFKGRRTIYSILSFLNNCKKAKELGLVYSGDNFRKYTPEVLRLYNLGYTTTAKIYNKMKEDDPTISFSINVVTRILKKEGLYKTKNQLKSEGVILNPEGITIKIDRDALYKSIVIDKKSYSQVAVEFKTSNKIIKDFCKIYKIYKPLEKKEVEPDKEYLLKKFLGKDILSKEDLELEVYMILPKDEILYLIKETNYNVKEITTKLEINKYTLFRAVEFLGLPKIPELSERSDEYLEELYINKKLPFLDIADITGRSIGNVSKYLRSKFPYHVPNENKFGGYKSRGEQITSEVLKLLDIKFRYDVNVGNHIFDNRDIIIDFIVNVGGKDIWIEYHGRQHYRCDSYKYFDEPAFLHQTKRDKKLQEYCMENSIQLIEIPYIYCSISSIKYILKSVLIENKSPKDVIDYSRVFKELEESLGGINKQDQV